MPAPTLPPISTDKLLVPFSEQVLLAIQPEADRMRNLRITAEDLASEMTVVRNEYERSMTRTHPDQGDLRCCILPSLWASDHGLALRY